MSQENFIKNITSKDINLSRSTIENLIKTQDIESFGLLCEKSDFIFPFLKERIISDFIKLIKEENLNVIFEFSKIYCADFEEIIVNSWLKFASQDLTDEILNLFEKGTNEQKAYCAKYFTKIQDPLALEYLNAHAFSDFEPLKTNCAFALSAFGDEEILNKMKEVVLNSNDEFEKLNALNFIANYGKENQIKFVSKQAFSSPFAINILTNILDINEINYLKNILDEKTLTKIFQLIIEEYPEDLSLDTCYYWNLAEYIKLIYNFNSQYSKNVLIFAREKFKEFSENDIYTFDFDKNIKQEVKNISKLLNSLELKFDIENFDDEFELNLILEIIKELKLEEHCDFLIDLFNKTNDEKKAQIASILKEFNKIKLINFEIVEQIENENIKALIQSYFT
ncbi:MAG: hypothetical protein IJB79_09260 [Candidatus Gastranaerophilales bacterium]|nr:hypothetical protein [Candidatus Gastranaerophilales bacterium]